MKYLDGDKIFKTVKQNFALESLFLNRLIIFPSSEHLIQKKWITEITQHGLPLRYDTKNCTVYK